MNEPEHGTPLTAEDPARLGDYELLGRLGEGGMGTVYLGTSDSGRHVAVKVIRTELATDEDFLGRFRDEALLAQRVSPFCTAQVVDYGMQGKIPYLVTEFVEGASLEDVVAQQGGLPVSTVHGIAVGVAAALTAIHAAGLMHRDLKPSNVLLSQSGPRVIDFGIAKPTENTTGRKSTVGVLVGTPGWIAPEQLTGGEVTTSVDVWAWGCLVAYGATGRHPFGRGNAAAIAYRALHDEPDLGDLDGTLARLARSALAPDPANRPTAQQLLLNLVGGEAAQASNTKSAVTAFFGNEWTPPPPAPPAPPGNSGPHPPHPPGRYGPPPQPVPQARPDAPRPPLPPHPSGPQARPVGQPRPPMPPTGMPGRPGPVAPGRPVPPPAGPRPGPQRPTGPTGVRPPQTGVHTNTGLGGPAAPKPQEDNRLVNWIAIGGVAGLAVVFIIVVILALQG